MIAIRQERKTDAAAREHLLDRAYGPARFTKCSARLREDRLPAQGLSFVATDEGRIVGSVRLWDVSAGPGRRALLLGPLAVSPEHQGSGIGGKLMKQAIAAARMRGHGAILLVGDAPYYEPVRLLGREDRSALDAGSLSTGPAAGARTACRRARWGPRHDRRHRPPRTEARSGRAGRGGFQKGCQKPDTARSLNLRAKAPITHPRDRHLKGTA